MTRSARLTIMALSALVPLAGCGSKSKDRTGQQTTAPLSSASGAGAGSGSATTVPITAGRGPGNVGTPGTTTPGGTPPASTSGQGSRFWYLNDTFGQPLKRNSAAEASIAAELLMLHNQERATAGLPALTVDAEAERAAKAHAEDMLGRNYFDHVTPEGWDPDDRLRMTGATGYLGFGENILIGSSNARAMHDAWMASAGHRANILNPQFTHVGFGIAQGYAVAVFLVR